MARCFVGQSSWAADSELWKTSHWMTTQRPRLLWASGKTTESLSWRSAEKVWAGGQQKRVESARTTESWCLGPGAWRIWKESPSYMRKSNPKKIGDAEFLSSAGGPLQWPNVPPLPGGRTEMMPKLRRTMWLRLPHTWLFKHKGPCIRQILAINANKLLRPLCEEVFSLKNCFKEKTRVFRTYLARWTIHQHA